VTSFDKITGIEICFSTGIVSFMSVRACW